MLFSGSDTRMFTLTGNADFDPVTAYSQATLDGLVNKILIYTNTSQSGPNASNTDFVKPLTAAYAMVDNDIASASNSTVNDAGVEIAPARYIIIFLSDGSPTIYEDPAIIQAIEEIDGLDGLTESPVPQHGAHLAASGSTYVSRTQGCSTARPWSSRRTPSGSRTWPRSETASSATSRTTSP